MYVFIYLFIYWISQKSFYLEGKSYFGVQCNISKELLKHFLLDKHKSNYIFSSFLNWDGGAKNFNGTHLTFT